MVALRNGKPQRAHKRRKARVAARAVQNRIELGECHPDVAALTRAFEAGKGVVHLTKTRLRGSDDGVWHDQSWRGIERFTQALFGAVAVSGLGVHERQMRERLLTPRPAEHTCDGRLGEVVPGLLCAGQADAEIDLLVDGADLDWCLPELRDCLVLAPRHRQENASVEMQARRCRVQGEGAVDFAQRVVMASVCAEGDRVPETKFGIVG